MPEATEAAVLGSEGTVRLHLHLHLPALWPARPPQSPHAAVKRRQTLQDGAPAPGGRCLLWGWAGG